MALDVTRLRNSIKQKQDDNIAALAPGASLDDIRNALLDGEAEAIKEEIETYLIVTVSNVQVDPQTGTQIDTSEASVATT